VSITHPDIAFCTKILVQNLKNPGPQHLAANYRYVDYLKDIKYLVLKYNGIAIPAPVFSTANDLEGPFTELAFIAINDTVFVNDIRSH